MRIGILYKKEKVKDKNVISLLENSLKERGNEVTVINTGAEIHNMDVLIVLGGDGAILHASIIAGQKNIKVVGINYGTLGFLAELEASETINVVDLICGENKLLTRTILKVTIGDKYFYALNEIVLQRDYARPYGNQVAEVGLVSDGQLLNEYVLDGIIVATPTGSTAYSLSAGGCILSPDLKGLIITPICPMGLSAKPFVLSDHHKISFDLSKEVNDMRLYADGRPIGTVNQNTKVLIEKAPFNVKFITSDVNKLLRNVQKKLKG